MVLATEFRKDVEEILPGVVADRRHLHENPELAFEEYETSKFVAERLDSLGVEDIRTGIGGTGVTGLIRGGKGDGKVVMARADMDALPILEENDVDYKSTKPGVMHACGHDAHTAMLLGLTRLLVDRKGEFPGTVKVLFQPAEEVPPGGAIAMIRDGALEDPHVDAVLGLHVSSETPAGKIAMRAGAGSASSDRFRITIQGRGGHAASPHEAVDPIVIGSHIVLAFQTLVSRETNPIDAAVLSTTAFIAGEAFNVIPDTAELRGTVRTLNQEVREHLEKRLIEVATGIARAGGAEVVADFIRGYPGIVNDEAMTEMVRLAAIDAVGEDNVIESPIGMGGEDFSYFSLERPGCFFNVGTRNEDRGIIWGHHHPRFDVEEEGMSAGIATMGNAVLSYLDS
ncbi:MAG: amidohydrolase [Chloroflexota bacterium]|nr:amidohydrolase [Chloroflexota bacterium]